MNNRYWVTYGYPSKGIKNGYIILWINKNPGAYTTDPYYIPLEHRRVITTLFKLFDIMPENDFTIKGNYNDS